MSELPSPGRGFTDAEPIDLAVGWLKQLGATEETDTVEPAGYPDALWRRFRAVREGKDHRDRHRHQAPARTRRPRLLLRRQLPGMRRPNT